MAAPPPVAFASAPHRADASSPNPTPLARRIARSENISLAGLTGTGPRGRIQKKDVLAQLAALAAMPGAISGGEPVPALHPGLRAADTLHSAWLRQGSGAPLVLLHGFSADLNNWRGLFAGARFDAPVLALDLPAHGQSAHSLAPDFDALCAQVEAAIAALVAGPLVLAGHSFGGAVAARLAARGVLDLRGLCLFAPAGLGPDINGGFTEGVLRAREAASLLPWLRELVDDPAIISEAFLRAVVEQRRDTGLTAAMQAFAERFFPDGTQTVTIRRDLAGLTLPARVVFGRNDRILPFAATRHLPGTVGLHALDACGHMPHLEHPALARRILSELLRGV